MEIVFSWVGVGQTIPNNPEITFNWVEYVILLGLIVLNAFFAASEIAIVTVRKGRMRQLADEGNGNARAVLRLNENSSKLLATIQVGVTLTGFFSAAFGAVSLVKVFEGLFKLIPLDFISGNANGIAFVVVTMLIAFLSLLFGELIPKTLAIELAEPLALRVARPIEFIARLFAPLIFILTTVTNFFVRLTGSKRKATMPSVSQEEIVSMVETGQEEGVVEQHESAIIANVFDFSDREVKDIMVPRLDVYMMEATTTVKQAAQAMLASGYSRYPVYAAGNRDRISGVVYVKDVLRYLVEDKADTPLQALLRPALFIPETKRLGDLLAQLQKSRTQIALVIDEYGSMAGLVTLEDCLEELVGEIQDEFDQETPLINPESPTSYLIDGSVTVDDLNDTLNLAITDARVDTVAGLVQSQLGRMAHLGDAITLKETRRIINPHDPHSDNIKYEKLNIKIQVEQVEGLRIRQVRLTLEKEEANQ